MRLKTVKSAHMEEYDEGSEGFKCLGFYDYVRVKTQI
jgi:hypothetical protein